MNKCICYIGLLFALLCPLPSSAEMTLFVSPDGDGAFIIEADNINNTSYVDITVKYDPAILSNPRVSLQGGTVVDLFDSKSGTLTFNAYRGDNPSSSFEAHLAFDKKGNSHGGIISAKAVTVEPDGTSIPSRSIINLPSPPSATAQATEPVREHPENSFSANECEPLHQGEGCNEKIDGAQPVTPGIAAAESVDSGAAAIPEKSAAAEEKAASLAATPDIRKKSEKSIVQQFMEFSGTRSMKAFVALFEQSPRGMFVQEPPVALSDGKSPVRVKLELHSRAENSPNVALTDAKLVQLRKENEKGWVVTVLPKEGTSIASIVISMDTELVEIPLVVAPSVKIRNGITESNFVAELDRYISDQVAGGKGVRLGVPYEFVFTANYLAGLGNRPPEMNPEQPRLVSNSKK
jgi:hypothetical protein